MTENNEFFMHENDSNESRENITENEQDIKIADVINDEDPFSYIHAVAEPPKKKNYAVVITALLMVVIIIISGLTAYCIHTDMKVGSIAFNAANGNNTQSYSIELYKKPESNRNIEYTDENGRYTTEGLAQYIRPQVVEIYAYSSEYPDEAIASGSGIIISEDGYIVTNTHVLDGTMYTDLMDTEGVKADSFVVRTHDDKKYDAVIAGRDTKTDIAVIKINTHGLPCATFGNSDETVLGEQVAAIGNPAGLTGSISDGIVSGLDRKIRADATGFEMNCIQTNAAISPGNSGGALVNMYGQVIGITSSKYVNSSYEGLGFAITINEAKPIIEELINNGYISGRIKVGITFYSSDNEYIFELFKEKYKREMPKKLMGLWITDISEECDVANTELKVNDFILSVNGRDVMCYDDLNAVLDGKKAGDVLKAECARIEADNSISYFEIEFKLMEDTSGDY